MYAHYREVNNVIELYIKSQDSSAGIVTATGLTAWE
jgi:hypothetical protein